MLLPRNNVNARAGGTTGSDGGVGDEVPTVRPLLIPPPPPPIPTPSSSNASCSWRSASSMSDANCAENDILGVRADDDRTGVVGARSEEPDEAGRMECMSLNGATERKGEGRLRGAEVGAGRVVCGRCPECASLAPPIMPPKPAKDLCRAVEAAEVQPEEEEEAVAEADEEDEEEDDDCPGVGDGACVGDRIIGSDVNLGLGRLIDAGGGVGVGREEWVSCRFDAERPDGAVSGCGLVE